MKTMKMINNILKINFIELPKEYQIGIIFCITFTIFSFLIMLITRIKSISSQELVVDINKSNKIITKKIKPAFFVITPYIPITKKHKQIIPYYLLDRYNMYSILEAFWWAEYTLWKKDKKWVIPNFVLGLRFISNSMAFAMVYVMLFWYIGLKEFQKVEYLGIVFVMFLWVFFFGAITTTYIHQKIVNYLSSNSKITKKDSIKIRWFAAWFWIWPFANVIFEHLRFFLWIFNYIKYKDINKK